MTEQRLSRLHDDEGLSSEFLVVEEGDTPQAMWIGVRRVWYGDVTSREPAVQLSYQARHNRSVLEGPIFIDIRTWRSLNRAVEWRLHTYEPRWKRCLRAVLGGSG